MYIDFVPNRGSKPAILLRESIREGKRIKKRTIANLSALTLEQAEAIRLVLKGRQLAPADGRLECIRSLPHGHVEAVRIAMRRLGFEKLIDGKASRERDLVAAMVAGRIRPFRPALLAASAAFSMPLGLSFGRPFKPLSRAISSRSLAFSAFNRAASSKACISKAFSSSRPSSEISRINSVMPQGNHQMSPL